MTELYQARDLLSTWVLSTTAHPGVGPGQEHGHEHDAEQRLPDRAEERQDRLVRVHVELVGEKRQTHAEHAIEHHCSEIIF